MIVSGSVFGECQLKLTDRRQCSEPHEELWDASDLEENASGRELGTRSATRCSMASCTNRALSGKEGSMEV